MRFLRVGVVVALVAAVAVAASWTDLYHLVIGGLSLAVIVSLLGLLRRCRTSWNRSAFGVPNDVARDAGDAANSPPLLRVTGAGVLRGVACCVYLYFVFLISDQIPGLSPTFYDRDRTDLEAQLATLESAGNHAKAAELIEDRLTRKLSHGWERELAQRLYQVLTAPPMIDIHPRRRVETLRRAKQVAKTYELADSRLADTLLTDAEQSVRFASRVTSFREQSKWDELVTVLRGALGQNDSIARNYPVAEWLTEAYVSKGRASRDLDEQVRDFRGAVDVAHEHLIAVEPAATLLKTAEAKLAAREELTKTITGLKSTAAHAELVALLRVHIREKQRPQWPLPFDRLLYDTLLDWGHHTEDLVEKHARYQEAKRTASAYRIQDNQAERRMVEVDKIITELRTAEQERRRPKQLAADVRANLLEIDDSKSPLVVFYGISVEDRHGAPIRGLTAKDFRVTIDGNSIPDVALAPVEVEPPRQFIAVVLDISESTNGSPLEFAKQGISSLLNRLADERVSVALIVFNSQVRRVCPWTTDVRLPARFAEPLAASGKTALWDAIAAALDDLKTQSGAKNIVLFTDGRNTAGVANAKSVLERCRREGAIVHAIGLKSADLDRTTLQGLAGVTGGQYVEADHPEQLVARFQSISRKLQRSFYRLAIAPPPLRTHGQPSLVQIHVGSDPGVAVAPLAVAKRHK